VSLLAGEFTEWLGELAAALRGDGDTDVACGSCVACCSSGQFIHIGPDESDALAHIPAELLFPAPRLPKGNVLMGYDEQGRCPMLGDSGCTIYEHRPRVCRTYDCRVFPAAGVFPEEPEKTAIAERARQWRFSYADAESKAWHDRLRAVAATLPADVPATPRAVEAVRRLITSD
jgi:Fe-S-cluster containining protein